MKFPLGLKPEACAAKERGRYAINGFQVERDSSLDRTANEGRTLESLGARATFSDGRCLAIVSCDLEPGDDAHGQVVDVDALKLARKVAGAKREASVAVNGKASAGGQDFELIDGEFPRYRMVIPDVKPETHVMVTLSAQIIRQVLDAVASELWSDAGSKPVTLCVSREHSATSPVVVAGAHALGVVMPLTVDGDALDAVERTRWARGGGK